MDEKRLTSRLMFGFLAILLLSACSGGGGGAGVGEPGDDPDKAGTRLSGNAQLGVIVGGSVAVLGAGGTELASDTTDASGRFGPVSIPDSHSGPLLIEISPASGGGSAFVCDFPGGCPDPEGRGLISFGEHVPYAATLSVAVTGADAVNSVSVNPITSAIVRRALSLGGLSAANIRQANDEMARELERLLGMDIPADIAAIPNVDLVNAATDASGALAVASLNLSLLNAGLIALVSPEGANDTIEKVVDDFADGFAADGAFGVSEHFNRGEIEAGELLYAAEQQVIGLSGTRPGITARIEALAPDIDLDAFAETLSNTRHDIAAVPPLISGSPPASVREDTTFSFAPGAADADGDLPLTFSILNKPPWASFNNTTGVLSGRPGNNDVGRAANIVITVTDSSGASAALPSFDIDVINALPVVLGAPESVVSEDDVYIFSPTVAHAEDIAGFSIQNKPEWAHFDAATGTLSGTPGNDDVGTWPDIRIGASDGHGTASLPAFTIEVVNLNDPPVISGGPPRVATEDDRYSFVPTAWDIDAGDSLAFSVVNLPAWASFDVSTGALTGVPTNEDVGVWRSITVSATDGEVDAHLGPFDIEVVNINDPPVISGTPSAVITEDLPYIFEPVATDVDEGDVLSFSINKAMAVDMPWATFSVETGELAGTPGNNDVGTIADIVITVTDSSGGTARLPPFDLEVVNAPLTITSEPAAVVPEDTPYLFEPVVDDPPDVTGFTIEGRPGWMNFDAATGTLSGTPGNDHVGIWEGIVIRASDGHESSTLAFSIQVDNVNDPPVFDRNNLPRTTIATNDYFTYTPTVTDVDPGPDTLSFFLDNAPGWYAQGFNPETGTLTIPESYKDPGFYPDIQLKVNDGLAEDVLSFSVSVVNPEKILVSWDAPSSRENGDPITVNDLIGYELTYYRQGDPGDTARVIGIDTLTNDLTSYQTEELPVGIWYFTLRAIDATGLEGDPSSPTDAFVDGDPG